MDDKSPKDITFRNVKITAKYDRFDLDANPFPLTGIASDRDPNIPPLWTQNNQELVDFITETYTSRKFGALVVIGDYGFGKTYILRYFLNRINEGFSDRGSECAAAIYVESPKPTPEDFAYEMLKGFGVEIFLNMLWRRLISETNVDDLIQKILPLNVQNNFFRDSRDSLRDLLTAADVMASPLRFLDIILQHQPDLSKLSDYFRDRLSTKIPIPDLLKGLCSFRREDTALRAFSNWRNFLDSDLRKILERQRKESEFISCMLKVLNENGIRTVYVLVDEFENALLASSKRERRNYLQSLREIFDVNHNHMALILAVAPGAWEEISQDSPAFSQRFSRIINLDSIDTNELQTVIALYLDTVRKNSSIYKGGALPFTHEAIDKIRIFARENLRVALETCFLLLEHAADKELDSIDEKQVENIPEIRQAFQIARLKAETE